MQLDRFKVSKANDARLAVAGHARRRAAVAGGSESTWNALLPIIDAAFLALDHHAAAAAFAAASDAAVQLASGADGHPSVPLSDESGRSLAAAAAAALASASAVAAATAASMGAIGRVDYRPDLPEPKQPEQPEQQILPVQSSPNCSRRESDSEWNEASV